MLAGDEFGNSQQGNNNAYAQDNEMGWLDWAGLEQDPDFHAQVRRLIELRRTLPLLSQPRYLHGQRVGIDGGPDIEWIRPDGARFAEDDWEAATALVMLLHATEDHGVRRGEPLATALLFNAGPQAVRFHLPAIAYAGGWRCVYSSSEPEFAAAAQPWLTLEGLSCACCCYAPA
jgi:isoamylase